MPSPPCIRQYGNDRGKKLADPASEKGSLMKRRLAFFFSQLGYAERVNPYEPPGSVPEGVWKKDSIDTIGDFVVWVAVVLLAMVLCVLLG